MDSFAELLFDEPRQFAFLATPAVIRALVPAAVPGMYMLLCRDTPFYVGRSDTCLQTRLKNHPLLCVATHVSWQACKTPEQAYALESAWFHTLRMTAPLFNQIHPARPAGVPDSCPFCSTGDCQAWLHFLRPGLDNSAATAVAADHMATAAKT